MEKQSEEKWSDLMYSCSHHKSHLSKCKECPPYGREGMAIREIITGEDEPRSNKRKQEESIETPLLKQKKVLDIVIQKMSGKFEDGECGKLPEGTTIPYMLLPKKVAKAVPCYLVMFQSVSNKDMEFFQISIEDVSKTNFEMMEKYNNKTLSPENLLDLSDAKNIMNMISFFKKNFRDFDEDVEINIIDYYRFLT